MPLRFFSFLWPLLLSTLLAPTPVDAHHGWSSYDNKTLLKIPGTIEQSTYKNPHGTLQLKTKEGSLTVILAPPSRMETRGLRENMLSPGTSVEVEGYRKNAASKELRAERITVDKKTVELR